MSHVTSLPLLGERVAVRRLRLVDDLPAFAAYRADPELARYQAWSPMTNKQASGFLESMSGDRVPQFGAWTQLAIADLRTDHLLGDMGLYVDVLGHLAEIGFTLSRAAQGRGFAADAVRILTKYLFSATEVTTIRAITDQRNIASIRLLTRAGFREVGEQEAEFKGERCIELTYEKRRSPFREST
jgi:[ribosomal protein S5]-alanine N-acetyltransferase